MWTTRVNAIFSNPSPDGMRHGRETDKGRAGIAGPAFTVLPGSRSESRSSHGLVDQVPPASVQAIWSDEEVLES
jgi:hypothetical protein